MAAPSTHVALRTFDAGGRTFKPLDRFSATDPAFRNLGSLEKARFVRPLRIDEIQAGDRKPSKPQAEEKPVTKKGKG